MPSSNNENAKANNNNNAGSLLYVSSSNNNNAANTAAKAAAENNNSKSASSAEGTRRVKPGTGKAKSRKEIGFAVNMKHAKKTLNNALGIKSMPPEFNPLIKIMKADYNSEAAKKAAINAHIEKVRKGREEKAAAKSAKKASNASATVKKPRKAKVANATPAAPAGNGAPASANTKSTKRSKREAPTNKEGKLKENMTAAKKQLNNALGIKSMPPEFNPLVTIMRKSYNSESDKQAAINAHIAKVRNARSAKAAKKAANKNAKGGSWTRKNRRS
jgi:hypothetical protein